jgi:hypothetical protein
MFSTGFEPVIPAIKQLQAALDHMATRTGTEISYIPKYMNRMPPHKILKFSRKNVHRMCLILCTAIKPNFSVNKLKK